MEFNGVDIMKCKRVKLFHGGTYCVLRYDMDHKKQEFTFYYN